MKECKVRNCRIQFDDSDVSGRLIYEGKAIPKCGYVMSFTLGRYSVYYAYPKVVPAYVKDRLESLRERIFM